MLADTLLPAVNLMKLIPIVFFYCFNYPVISQFNHGLFIFILHTAPICVTVNYRVFLNEWRGYLMTGKVTCYERYHTRRVYINDPQFSARTKSTLILLTLPSSRLPRKIHPPILHTIKQNFTPYTQTTHTSDPPPPNISVNWEQQQPKWIIYLQYKHTAFSSHY